MDSGIILKAVFGAVASCAAVHIGFSIIPGMENGLHDIGHTVAEFLGLENASPDPTQLVSGGHNHPHFNDAIINSDAEQILPPKPQLQTDYLAAMDAPSPTNGS